VCSSDLVPVLLHNCFLEIPQVFFLFAKIWLYPFVESFFAKAITKKEVWLTKRMCHPLLPLCSVRTVDIKHSQHSSNNHTSPATVFFVLSNLNCYLLEYLLQYQLHHAQI